MAEKQAHLRTQPKNLQTSLLTYKSVFSRCHLYPKEYNFSYV